MNTLVPQSQYRTCSIVGCNGPVIARRWCGRHYHRWERHGSPLGGGTDRGAPRKFLDEAIKYTGEDCLKWPYATDVVGYGRINRRGTSYLAHRLVCERIHGPAPTPKHHAIHFCGKGHEGCCNPNHIRWGTHSENMADKVTHGTDNRGERCAAAKLTRHDVRDIRRLRGKFFQREIAEMYGVHPVTVCNIQTGVTWGWLA